MGRLEQLLKFILQENTCMWLLSTESKAKALTVICGLFKSGSIGNFGPWKFDQVFKLIRMFQVSNLVCYTSKLFHRTTAVDSLCTICVPEKKVLLIYDHFFAILCVCACVCI